VVYDDAAQTFDAISGFLGRPAEQVQGPRTTTSVEVTGRWEGVVRSVADDLIEAEFAPVDSRSPSLKATLLRSEVDHDDLELVKPGALFYLVTSRVRVSAHWWQPSASIHFRRIPEPGEAELLEAQAYAAELREELGRSG
jgi:hypothetical protein